MKEHYSLCHHLENKPRYGTELIDYNHRKTDSRKFDKDTLHGGNCRLLLVSLYVLTQIIHTQC